MGKTITLLLLLLLSVPAPAIPADSSVNKGGRVDKQIDIKSNELVTDKEKKTATFIGSVVAKQEDLTVYSDKLVIHYDPNGDVEMIEADGNVRIVQQNKLGTGGHAVYDLKEGKITLTVNPRVQQGEDSVAGEVITYYVDQDRSQATGTPGSRVRAIINPKGKAKSAPAQQ